MELFLYLFIKFYKKVNYCQISGQTGEIPLFSAFLGKKWLPLTNLGYFDKLKK